MLTDDAEMAVLRLFQRTVDADALMLMGDPANPAQVPELADFTTDDAVALLDRASDAGLVTSLGGGYYQLAHLDPTDPPPYHHAYAYAMAALANHYQWEYDDGDHSVIGALVAEEANLLYARALARANGWWAEAIGCMQGLRTLYAHTGQLDHWAYLVNELEPDLVDPTTGEPQPGREEQWSLITEYRVELAIAARNLTTALSLQKRAVAWNRRLAADALAADPKQLDDDGANRIRTLAVSLEQLGNILRDNRQPECVSPYEEAFVLLTHIGAGTAGATAYNLGNAYLAVPELHDPDQAERWYRQALGRFDLADSVYCGLAIGQLGQVALIRLRAAQVAGAPQDQLVARAVDVARHYELASRHFDRAGDRFQAGRTRYHAAAALSQVGQSGDALALARAALADYQSAGVRAEAEQAQQLITSLGG